MHLIGNCYRMQIGTEKKEDTANRDIVGDIDNIIRIEAAGSYIRLFVMSNSPISKRRSN